MIIILFSKTRTNYPSVNITWKSWIQTTKCFCYRIIFLNWEGESMTIPNCFYYIQDQTISYYCSKFFLFICPLKSLVDHKTNWVLDFRKASDFLRVLGLLISSLGMSLASPLPIPSNCVIFLAVFFPILKYFHDSNYKINKKQTFQIPNNWSKTVR